MSTFITYNGKTLNMSQWAKILGITREALRIRLLSHSIDDALGPNFKKNVSSGRKPTLIKYNGRTQTLNEWAEELEINPSALRYRIKKYNLKGLSPDFKKKIGKK